MLEPQISLPSLSCRAQVPKKCCVGLGKVFLLVFIYFRKVCLFFREKKMMLFFSPHSSILLPEMDVMTGALGASMDQKATQGGPGSWH